MSMKSVLTWTGGMHLTANSRDLIINMDAKAPIGKDEGMTPKELVLAGLGGCTAMDVLALLKKHKQTLTSFEVSVEADTSTGGHPMVFTHGKITFQIKGTVDPQIALNAVTLSQTQYCGVSAMLAKAFPIEYFVYVNDELAGKGMSNFVQ